jgi:hypothetical protein
VKLRAAVSVAFAFCCSRFPPSPPTRSRRPAKPAATKPAASKPAAGKPATSKTTGEKTPAAPLDSLAMLEKKVAKDSTNFDNLYQLA